MTSRAGLRRVPLRSLLLDAENPRITADLLTTSQEELAVHLALAQGAFVLAESMASHGFFESEPLVVIEGDGDPDRWVVLEGNRRLTALLGLADPTIRSQLSDADEWDRLAGEAGFTLDSLVPVSVVGDRTDAVAIIGFRHIVGILNWEPYAQARYVARLVDSEGMTFAEVADVMKIAKVKVQGLYRDQAITAQAQTAGIDTGSLEDAFSLLSLTMGNAALRDHAGVPAPTKTVLGSAPVPADKIDGLSEVLTWVFGSAEQERVISDSRQISKLGKVVGAKVGVDSLRAGESLDQAYQKVHEQSVPPRDVVTQRLTTARSALRGAAEFAGEFIGDEEIDALVSEVEEALNEVAEIIRSSPAT
jgi:hypothetical protein